MDDKRSIWKCPKERENLAQYLARPPISLKKVSFESFHGRVLFHTPYNQYFKESLNFFKAWFEDLGIDVDDIQKKFVEGRLKFFHSDLAMTMITDLNITIRESSWQRTAAV